MRRHGLSLRHDEHGVALVEFALVLPVLVILFIGSFQISEAVFAYRKVTTTARTIADLTSQYTGVTTSDLDTILSASQQVLAPYDVAPAKMVVSEIGIDSGGGATVLWSRGKNTAGNTPGSWFYVPPAYKQNNTTIIVADISYGYVPSFASSFLGSFNMKEQVTMFPRRSTTIPCTGCS